ncbi:TonB-dependent receptor [Pseudoxanthomonas composti]|uniref:TonB-dependent receptor n=1 Tax=Pseudoxanthomonas composti TaxID=2137479 RepID=A0A4Q1JYG9_9GAMM|nr:TonB-dependent receptor [Pseudoxanthomonas composti]
MEWRHVSAQSCFIKCSVRAEEAFESRALEGRGRPNARWRIDSSFPQSAHVLERRKGEAISRLFRLVTARVEATACALKSKVFILTLVPLLLTHSVAAQEGQADTGTAQRDSPEGQAAQLDVVTVTGTRIKGGASPSPVVVIGSERIREEGFTDLGQVIRSIPQNFSGGQNPGVLMGNVAGGGLANQNVTGGSGLNLRGLGPDASLTLLNGRRMSYGGFVQAVDISAIPVEAVERIEIMADGASAIYGSDAVGGVGNVILKRDMDGVTVGGRYGAATSGGLATREYTASAGTVWPTGGVLATFKDASVDPIHARQRGYTAQLPDPYSLFPASELRSVLLSTYQTLGDRFDLQIDAVRTRRDQRYEYYYGTRAIYNLLSPQTTTTFVAPSLEYQFGSWGLTLGGAWGKDEYLNRHDEVSAASGAATPYLYECFCNASRSAELGAEGPVMDLAAGEARLALGAGHRTNEFSWTNLYAGSEVMRGEEASRFAYAELSVPLLGTETGRGQQRLELTGAVRRENYDSFGGVSTPKLGLTYSPSKDLTFKASWGRSFKAPTLFQQYRPQIVQMGLAQIYGSPAAAPDALMMIFAGGNPDLSPERARTWSTSLVVHPDTLPGFEAELSWFEIDYAERVVEPIGNFYEALSSPIYAEFVTRSPSADQQAAAISDASYFFNFTGVTYDPSNVVALLDSRYVNAMKQRIRGADLSASYKFDVGSSELTVRGAASWLNSQQRTRGTPQSRDLAGMLHNPAKLNARAGAVWVHGGLTASTFVTFIDGVTNPSDGIKGSSFTTLDATLSYRTGERAGVLSGLDLQLAATNLLDWEPPRYATISPEYVPPYDSTNYSAIGRFVGVSVSRHW